MKMAAGGGWGPFFGRKWARGGLEEAKNDDFDRKLTQMDANGGWNCLRSEVRGPKSDVGGPKTGKMAFILFSCCFLFSCLAAVYFRPSGRSAFPGQS